jgi:GT2 family glycosyltransferase
LPLPPISPRPRFDVGGIKDMQTIPSVAALLTCFNRRENTLSALESLFHQHEAIPRKMTVILVDDGSTDGTAEAVASSYPTVRILRGDGSLFWTGGMRVAFAEAMRSDFDYYLWLNDDTRLFPDALDGLLASAQKLERDGRIAIVTGSTCDPVQGNRTYGGFRRQLSWKGIQFLPVQPLPDALQPCDIMNGNCTLIPRAIAREVGNLDAAFRHSVGDFDYGFRARAAGFGIYIAPGYVGSCTQNSVQGTWRDRTAPFEVRWRNLVSHKGLPFKEWLVYTHRHYGALWPLYTVSPYLKTLLGVGLGRS